jgi:hypothetical protein
VEGSDGAEAELNGTLRTLMAVVSFGSGAGMCLVIRI